MRGRFNTRQRNYIILGLCSILLVMAAGYAAFSSRLTINGTSNITSEFKVLITDIQSSVLVGEATDAETPTHTETTATFKTNLVSPGDSMQYDITVENQGDIDAVLESIDVNTSDNAAILFEATGIKRGDKLLPDESDILTVTVTYNPDVTRQPENLNATVTVTLNYVQDNGTVLPEPDPIDIGGIEVMPVTSGDGLYGDEYTSGRYVYRGTNPNNYIMFNNELWRIISKEADGTYKILRNEVFPDMAFDSRGARTTGYCSQTFTSYDGCNAWASTANIVGSPSEFTNGRYSGSVDKDSETLTYLNGEYLDSITFNKDKIVSHDFNIGSVTNENNDLQGQIESEKSYKWNGNVGLISLSDYLMANSDMKTCGTFSTNNLACTTCINTNWMVIGDKENWWTLSPLSDDPYSVFRIFFTGTTTYNSVSDTKRDVRPSLYLTSSLSLSGSGTQSDPFRIIN